MLCDCRTDHVTWFGVQSATITVFSQPLSWLLISHHHGFQSAATMASIQPLPWLPVSYYHGFQSATIMASSQLLPWLPVSHHHGFQSATTMASSQPLPWLLLCWICFAAWQAAAQRHNAASSFIIFCHSIAIFFRCYVCAAFALAWPDLAQPWLSCKNITFSNTCFVGQVVLKMVILWLSHG